MHGCVLERQKMAMKDSQQHLRVLRTFLFSIFTNNGEKKQAPCAHLSKSL